MVSFARARAVAIAVAVLAAAPEAFQSRRSWAPGLQPVSGTSPPLDAAAAIQTFRLPPGYRIELVASEPLIQDPILIDWDPDGRLWAIEMPGYMPTMLATTEFAPTGRIVVLEDVDGNGAMDRRTVFLDGLVLPRSLKVLTGGVIVGAPPSLWFVRDTNGDLRADSLDVISSAYGNRATGPEHNPNGLLWGLDNWIHTSQWDRILRLQGGTLVTAPTLARGQWGLSMDDAGRIYRNTNEAALHVDLVPARYYARQTGLQRTRGLFESLQTTALNAVWPIRPTRGVNRGYQTGILRPDGRLARFTAVCAPTVYRGDRLPADLYGNVFVAEPAGNLVSRIVVGDRAGSLQARKAYADAEFLASTDERFRPVYLSSAPDGTLYVVDLYRGIIQHRTFITEYLRDHIVAGDLEQPTGLGRIYRIVHTSTSRDVRPALSSEPAARLVSHLSHANGWWRDTAQRLLVERGDQSVAPLLRDLAARARDTRVRLHALWTLDGLNALEPAIVAHALGDPSSDVRAAGLRLSERWITQADHPLQAAVIDRLGDADWVVRRQLAATLGMLPAAKRFAPIAALLADHGGDPVTVDAALSGLSSAERAALTKTLASASRKNPGPDSSRSASKTIPGPPPACPTCPGARGGPGGARAFPSTTGRGPSRAPLTTDAPVVRTPPNSVAPGSEEHERFTTGRELYASLCATCHEADRGGGVRLPSPLIGSPVATGPASAAIRVVLHGKAGTTGVMPAFGDEMPDEDIASVLTYVRRAWGHTASTVTRAMVEEVRARTSDRTQPWTDEELVEALSFSTKR
jgi:putative membrane-bound dehydrogenase-like protein